jgi:hypothetical protein
MAQKRTSFDATEELMRIVQFVEKKGDTDQKQIRDALCTGKRKHFTSMCSSMTKMLVAMEVLIEVSPSAGTKPGVFGVGPKIRRAKQTLGVVEKAGILRIPWGTFGQARTVYLAELAAVSRGKPREAGHDQAMQEITTEKTRSHKKTPTVTVKKPAVESQGELADFLLDGRLPEGHVLLKRNGAFVLGRPEDLRRLQGAN